MNQALYRKYRSKSFADVVGQDHITKTLKRAIKQSKISHAYLFTGPRGVGKTSVARILAHEVNKLDYKNESVHLDIIEIDAASNRRIDEIRDLRDKVNIAPSSGKYKVYIIDEVHMLTREAFNALLKTLEEPPAHCIFILATTEAHKLPETIISRTQRFEFKVISPADIASHLGAIAKRESINITGDALNLLAEFGRGSFRDSISYLDQLSSMGEQITEDVVRDLLGIPSSTEILKLVSALDSGNLQEIASTLQSIKDKGISAANIASAISDQLRVSVVSGNYDKSYMMLMRQLIEVPSSSQPFDYLELSLLEAADSRNSTPEISKNIQNKSSKSIPSKIEFKQNVAAASLKKDIAPSKFRLDRWEEVLLAVKNRNAAVYTALRLAQPSYDSSELVLKFEFPLHKKKLEQAKNKQLVSQLMEEMFGLKIKVVCVVEKSLAKQSFEVSDEGQIEPEARRLNAISNVFGVAEVLD